MPMGFDRCLPRTGSIRFTDTDCNTTTTKLSKFKSAPDVIASFRLKTSSTLSEITVRPMQLTSAHRSFRRNDSRFSMASSCPTQNLEPAFHDIDWDDVVDVDVDGYDLTAEILEESLSLLYPTMAHTTSNAIHKLMLDKDCGFGSFKFDVLSLRGFLPSSSLLFVSHVIFRTLAFDGLDLKVLLDWVRVIDAKYNPSIPYHNADHAADVLHSLFSLFVNTELRTILSEPMQIAGLLAAITHDVAHFGRTNSFLHKSKHQLTTSYPVCCPLEEMHAAVGLDQLLVHNVLGHFPKTTQEELRKVIHSVIFTTSLCEQKRLLTSLRSLDENSSNYSLLLLQAAVHAADLGQTSKPYAVHKKWVYRLHEELLLQGDVETSLGWTALPICDRARGFSTSGQLYFMQNLVLPVYSVLDDLLRGGLDAAITQLQGNIEEWKLV